MTDLFSAGSQTTAMFVFAVLLAGTVVCLHAYRRRSTAERMKNIRRVRTWWIISIVFFTAAALGRTALVILFFLVIAAGLAEVYQMQKRTVAPYPPGWLILLAAVVLFAAFAVAPFPVPLLLSLLAGAGAAVIFTVRKPRPANLITWASFLLVTCGVGAVVPILDFSAEAFRGFGLLLFLLLMTAFNDVAQYVWGRNFGRRKILPRISPNKSWTGFLGGVVTTAVLGAGISPLLTPLHPLSGAGAGGVIALAGFGGDAAFSVCKRAAGAKDSGALLPGHGGILDRIDSLCLSAPLFYVLLVLWH